METKYLSCAATAQLVRTALKEAFPGVKFSVRSKTYSGGASISIGWTDGPTGKQVEAIADEFAGATFDGMTDCKSSVTAQLDGRRVHFGADFIFCNRDYSDRAIAGALRRVCQRFGVDGDHADLLAKFKRGDLHNVPVAGVKGWDSHWNLQTQVQIALAKHTYTLARPSRTVARVDEFHEAT